MSEFVKKTIMGYKEVQGGHSDPECTHVIMTQKEYSVLLQKISHAEYEAREAKSAAEKAKREARESAEYQVWHAGEEANKKIAAMQEKMEKACKKGEYYRELNENLLRISRERANADRKLERKKDHSGYVVTYSAEKEYRYKIDRWNWGRVMLWETVLQSPYSADFTEQQARTQIWEDLFRVREDNTWQIGRLGLNAHLKGKYETLIEKPNWNTEYAQRNVLLTSETKLRLNFNQLYWEVVIQHTKPLGVVPPDMRARQK